MIVKEYSQRGDIKTLEALKTLNQDKSNIIDKELRILKAGDEAEAEAARMLARWLTASRQSFVINDLRLMVDNEVVQIDHLIVNRAFRFSILETKSFKRGLRVNEHGEYFRKLYNDWIPIRSPIAQANSQKDLLDRFLRKNNILPTRLGMRFTPDVTEYVMISPETIFEKPAGFDASKFLKFDTFMEIFENETIGVGKIIERMINLTSYQTLLEFCQTLNSLHVPQRIDWPRKLGLKPLPSNGYEKSGCKGCGSPNPEMTYGRHGYYFKCGCGTNSSVKLPSGYKIRKAGKKFFLTDPDGIERLLHTNQ